MPRLYLRITGCFCLLVFGIFVIRQLTLLQKCFEGDNGASKLSPDPDSTERRFGNYENRGIYSEDITVVTAYFDLGTFQKGTIKPRIYSKKMYEKRLEEYGRLENYLVAFFDDPRIYNNFKRIRAGKLHRTKIFLINKNNTLSFQRINKVRNVLFSPGYPKFHPDTVVPEYGCAMNAKYELTELAARANYFNTSYFSWFDGGFFQDQTDSLPFKVATPPGFDPEKVAYGQLLPRNSELSSREIFLTNQWWVCGCVFVARRDVMIRWTQLYQTYAEGFLKQRLASTDEQVVYAMFSDKVDKPPIRIQMYWERPSKNEWSVLGYVMKENWRTHSMGYLI